MYPVPDSYVQKIHSGKIDSGDEKISGSINFADGSTLELNNDNVQFLRIQSDLINPSTLGVGDVNYNTLEMRILCDCNAKTFTNATVKPIYSLRTSGGVYFDVPLWTFYIDETSVSKDEFGIVGFSGYDCISRLDDYIDKNGGTTLFPAQEEATADVFSLMSQISEKVGIPLAQTFEDYKNFPNFDEMYPDEWVTSGAGTWRELVSALAHISCCFCAANRSDMLFFNLVSGAESPVRTIPRDLILSLEISDDISQFNAIRQPYGSNVYGAYAVGATSLKWLSLPKNQVWDSQTEFYGWNREKMRVLTTGIWNNISNLAYTPAKIDYFGDPALECGDKIVVQTESGDKTILVTGFTWTFGASQSLESLSPSGNSVSGSLGAGEAAAAKDKVSFHSDKDFFPVSGSTNVIYVDKTDLKQWLWDAKNKAYVPFSRGEGIPPPFLDRPPGEYPLGFFTQIRPPNDPDHPEYSDMEIFFIRDNAPLQKYVFPTKYAVNEDSTFWVFGILHIGDSKKMSETAEFVYVIFQPHFADVFPVISTPNLVSDTFFSALYSNFNHSFGPDFFRLKTRTFSIRTTSKFN
jgi:hypothetical protein